MKRTQALVATITVVGTFIFSFIALPPMLWAGDKPVELKMSVMMGTKSSKYVKGFDPWARKVEQATNGKVKIVIYPSNSLAAASQNFDACIDGIVDIGWIAVTQNPGRFPLTEVLQIPGVGMKDPVMDSEITWKLFKQTPEMQKEFSQVKVLFMHAFSPLVVSTTETPVRRVEDLKGLKLRAPKGCAGLLKAAGAAPVFMPPSEIYLNMQKGIIQGSTMGWEGQRSFGSIKLAKYYTMIPALPGNHFVMFMNKGKWDALSPEIQEAVMGVSGETAARFFGEGDYETGIEVVKQIREMEGSEIIELSDEEDKKFMELAKPLQEEFIASTEAKGLPGRKTFGELMKMVRDYKR